MNCKTYMKCTSFRGFSNLFRKENRAWWRTRRWWINALLWPVILCGLMVNMLFVPSVANLAPEAEVAGAGGVTAFLLEMALSVFFEFGLTVVAIGVVILASDLIIGEKMDGTAEWLLSKPIARRSYILSKIAATLIPMLVLVIGIPAADRVWTPIAAQWNAIPMDGFPGRHWLACLTLLLLFDANDVVGHDLQ